MQFSSADARSFAADARRRRRHASYDFAMKLPREKEKERKKKTKEQKIRQNTAVSAAQANSQRRAITVP